MNLPFPHFTQQLVVLEYVRSCDVGKYAALIGSDRAVKIDKHVWLLRVRFIMQPFSRVPGMPSRSKNTPLKNRSNGIEPLLHFDLIFLEFFLFFRKQKFDLSMRWDNEARSNFFPGCLPNFSHCVEKSHHEVDLKAEIKYDWFPPTFPFDIKLSIFPLHTRNVCPDATQQSFFPSCYWPFPNQNGQYGNLFSLIQLATQEKRRLGLKKARESRLMVGDQISLLFFYPTFLFLPFFAGISFVR